MFLKHPLICTVNGKEVDARLDLYKKLERKWKDRSNSTSFKRENPRDEPVLNLRDSWSRKSASFLLSAVVERDVYT